MKKLSFNLSVLLLLTFCNSSIAQISQPDKSYYPVPDHPEWFKTIPLIDESTPDWAILMYESDIDFNRIETLKTRYYRLHPFEKTIHTQNYKYWYKTVKDYIDDNGHVNLPVAGEVYSRYESLKRTNPKHYRSESAIWQNIGPNNTYINNGSLEVRPTQANVYCLGVAPSNPSIVYAGMETGGVFKSVDKGLSWFPVTNDYAIGNIHDIKVDPLDPDIVYASRDKELYKSIDGGTTWNLQYLSSARIEQLYIHSSVTDTLYAATADGLLKSPDGGASWSSKFSGRLYDIEVKPGTDSIFYVAVENTSLIRPEIWKSTDYGNTWTLMDNGYYIPSDLSVAQVNGCKIGVTPADPNRVYAGIIATGKTGDNGWIGIYYSLDEGATWQEDSGFDGGPYASGNDPSTNWYVAGYSSGYHQGFYNFDIDVSHNDPDKLWIGTIWFCESGNKGGNIEYIRGTRSLEMHADIQDIDVVGDDIWIASDGGINYSDDECQTVEVRMNGITASDYWGWGQGWNEDTWVGGRYHNGNAAFHENYGAGNTLFLGGAETPTGYVNPFDNRKMYMSDISDKLIPTSLSSTSTNISNLGLYPTQGYYHFNFSEVEWDPRYANHVYVGKEKTLFKSIDGGSTFDTLYTFPGDMRRFEISRKKPDYIYAIIYIDYWTWKIYKSSDGGSSFTELPAPSLTGGSWRNLSFTLNPFNEEEIWLASNSSSNGNKIFQSINGGGTWVNKYSGLIQDQKIKDLLYHPSPQGDLVYALTDDNFFYYSVNENTWTQYNSGFPIQHTGFLISPFYRDNKIRVPSAKGIWEAPLVNNSTIQAMPMVLKDKIYCSRDTVRFESFSILNADGATFTWSFPGAQYVDDPTLRNPKVVYGNNGVYDVTLTITQLDGQTDTKTIAGMIVVDSDCEPDRIAGDALNLDGASSDYVTIPALNQSFNEFTIAGWIKRNGDQPSYAGIFFSRGSKGIGLNFRDNNQLGYHPYYWWNSGHTVPDNEWTYVALVFEGNQTAIYMNGIRASRNSNDTPLPFDASLYIGADPNFGSRRFNGQIDEVNIWSRALTQDEIRLHRHLTKDAINDNDLIHYYQFNSEQPAVNDKIGVQHATMSGNASKIKSDGPYGGGVSDSHDVNGPVTIQSVAGVDLEFGNSGNHPDGEIIITKINNPPNTNPDGSPTTGSYWIINNYGSSSTITSLNSLTFHDLDNTIPISQASDFSLSNRPPNSHSNNWTAYETGDVLDTNNKQITFNGGLANTDLGQFTISNTAAKGWIGVVSTSWDDPQNWGEGVIPAINAHVIIPPGTPFVPLVNMHTTIKSLTLMEGAVLNVENGKIFQVGN